MKFLLFCIIIFCFHLKSIVAEVKFGKDCEENILKLISESLETIDIAVYSINNTKIAEELLKAKERSVKIRILTDRTQAFGKTSKVRFLYDNGFDVKVHSKQRIMHHKFAIFDNKYTSEGSFNWTNSAANKNAEDCNINNNEQDIETLNQRFQDLWLLNNKEVSECYFKNMILEKIDRISCKRKYLKRNKIK